MITARYFDLEVEVVDALDGTATIRALNPAHTWASWTHGGWAFDNETNVPVRMLKDVYPGNLGETDEQECACKPGL